MEPSTIAVSIIGGTVSLASMAVAFVQWSLRRNVEHEDEWRRAVDGRLTKLATDVSSNEQRTRDLANAQENATRGLGDIKAGLKDIHESIEDTTDRQARAHREELAKLEATFRQEISRNVHPELPDKVMRLEAQVEALRAGRASSRKKR
jgi:septal ring factor EnvC (AmiA/AmiB activator)